MVSLSSKSSYTPVIKSPVLENYDIKSCINNGRNLVLLVTCVTTKIKYAMKVYPYTKGNISAAYLSEARFSWLSHANVVKIEKIQPRQEFTLDNISKDASFILMEYASFGSFRNLTIQKEFQADHKLGRTYFKQLIKGIEYLHGQEVSHLDLKLDNLLLGEDYNLKITDFDTSYIKEDIFVLGKGTPNFRAPELKNGRCKKTKMADIYSAGIILFTFVAGILPYNEDCKILNHDLFDIMFSNPTTFWEVHENIKKKPFDKEFKELFEGMTKLNPLERLTISQIKQSRWYVGPSYNDFELIAPMKQIIFQ